ncbi:MAG: hypothetical protein QM572_02115 [Nocardioides sp.]|uniref:hypothetical protein n=1 Tax=Nocardioides sp. TaxID=35761 RepID=UPI0039E6D45E
MPTTDRAHRLLDAHVAYEVRRLRGDDFPELIRAEVDHLLGSAAMLTLGQVVHRDQVKAVARKYVATFRLPAAIPEIAGEVATLVRRHPANATPLGEVIARDRVVEIVDVLAEMRDLRTRVMRGIAQSTSLQLGVGEVARGIAADAVGSGRKLMRKVPGAGLAGRATGIASGLVAPVVDPLATAVDQRSREATERATKALLGYVGDSAALSISDDELREAALELWDALAAQPISALWASVTDAELVDLLVALYDGWLDLRSADYVHAAVDVGVDVFFDTYADTTLTDLIAEFGLGPDDLVEEALRFAPPVLDVLAETGMLETLIRRQLEPFYSSPEAAALLA